MDFMTDLGVDPNTSILTLMAWIRLGRSAMEHEHAFMHDGVPWWLCGCGDGIGLDEESIMDCPTCLAIHHADSQPGSASDV